MQRGGLMRQRNRVRPDLPVPPKKAMRALERKAGLLNFYFTKGQKISYALPLIGGGAAGILAGNRKFGAGAALGAATALLGLAKLHADSKANSSMFRLLADAVGRPRMAKRLALKFSDKKVADAIRESGELPFFGGKRYFSKEEIKGYRDAVLGIGAEKKSAEQRMKLLSGMLAEKARIAALAEGDRGLVEAAYGVVFKKFGISKDSRELAFSMTLAGLRAKGSFIVQADTEFKSTQFVFTNEGGKWSAKTATAIDSRLN